MQRFLETFFVLLLIVQPFVVKYAFTKMLDAVSNWDVLRYGFALVVAVIGYVTQVAIAAEYITKFVLPFTS